MISVMARTNKALRILHTPTLTGNQPGILAAAERSVGLDSHCISLYPSRFNFQTDEQLWLPGDGLLRREIKRWQLFFRVMRAYDVIHFNFGRGLAPPAIAWSEPHQLFPRKNALKALYCLYAFLCGHRDLWVLKHLGKKIVVTFMGDDCRNNAYCAQHFSYCIRSSDPLEQRTAAWDRIRARNVAAFDRYADRIYGLNPDLFHFLPPRAEFLPYASVDPAACPLLPHPARAMPLVIHAPSSRNIKGTSHILAAVETLKKEGVAFDFKLVENMSHQEACALYAQADLVIDQLLAGWYGGFAVECMSMGKPVIAYLREEDFSCLPAEMATSLPLINANPDTIEQVLREWLTTKKSELPERGRISRRFVEQWHDPKKIALRLKRDYEGLFHALPNSTNDQGI
jgi:glycosyltransferase involved in cell wall biosynthesis